MTEAGPGPSLMPALNAWRRSSNTRSTAATMRSALIGKWCTWAPRLTPALLQITVVDEAA